MAGLLDGLLGSSMDDPRTAATLQLAQGLLSSPRGMQGLSSGLLGYQQAMQENKKQKAAEEYRVLQMQQQQMQLQQMQRAAKQQEQQDAFRQSLRSPQQQAVSESLAGGMSGAFKPGFGASTNPALDSFLGGGTQAAPRQNAPQIPQSDPTQELMFGAMKAGLVDPVAYINSQRKDKAPLITKAGDVARDPETGRELWRNEDKAANMPSALREYEYAKGQGYGGSFLDFQLAQKRAGASNTTVSLGSPVPVTMPDGSTVLVQPSNRPGAPPQILTVPGTGQPMRPPPSEKAREAQRENAAAMSKVDRALAAIDATPSALGGKNYLDIGGAVMQRADPGGIETRALIADIGSAKIHDRSGAAVTAAEFPRLRPFVPLATDTPETAKKKLTLFRQEMQFLQQELNSGATLQQTSAPRKQPGLTLPSADAIAAELARRAGGQ